MITDKGLLVVAVELEKGMVAFQTPDGAHAYAHITGWFLAGNKLATHHLATSASFEADGTRYDFELQGLGEPRIMGRPLDA